MAAAIDERQVLTRMLAIRDGLARPKALFPVMHLLLKATVATSLMVAALWELATNQFIGWHWLAMVPALVFASVLEHVIHRGPMHHRSRLSPMSFRLHVLVHHRVFAPGIMGVQSLAELFFVVFHWRFDVLVLVVMALAYGIASLLGAPLVGDVLVVTFAIYAMCLDWIHVIDHLPDSWLGRLGLDWRPIHWLRRYHAVHHDPRRMNELNFNILIPLGDWLLRTYRSEACPVSPTLPTS